jgi:fumarate reductase subunit C
MAAPCYGQRYKDCAQLNADRLMRVNAVQGVRAAHCPDLGRGAPRLGFSRTRTEEAARPPVHHMQAASVPHSQPSAGETGTVRPRASRWPARLDLAQSLSGLALALFMWGHMFFVSTILLSKDAMWTVTRFFEGYYVFGRSYPIVVSVIVAGVMALIVLHALLAMRKFPGSFRQVHTFVEHRATLKHADTTLWWVQALTGFALFFLAFPHLHQMLIHPADIGPYESADRVWTGLWWPLYLVLLFVVELHGGIGLYRLAVKWGWLTGDGDDANATRRKLKIAKWAITVLFLALGLATLAAYMKIGYEHRERAGERYVPASAPAQDERR